MRMKMTLPNVLVITDVGNDYDDMMALLILGYFHKLQKITLKGVIVTLDPVLVRAQLTEGLLKDCMGITDVQVAVGTEGSDEKREQPEWEKVALDATFLSQRTDFPSHLDLCKTLFSDVQRKKEKIRLLSIASLRDVWSIVQQDRALFSKVVSEIHIQGGWKEVDYSDNGVQLTKKILYPSEDARNNRDDPIAAEAFFEFIRNGDIPCTVYDKEVAVQSTFEKTVFDPKKASKQMEKVAEYIYRIHDVQKKFYYEAALKPPNERFRPNMDRIWFIDVNTKGLPDELRNKVCTAEQLLPYTIVTPYDPIAALGSIQDVTGVRIPSERVKDPSVKNTDLRSVGDNVSDMEGAKLAKDMCAFLSLALRMT
jgi:hypothetical protein